MLKLTLKAWHVAIAVLMLTTLALAAPLAGIDGLPRWMKAGFWAGSATVQAVAANKVTTSAGAVLTDMVFPAVDAGACGNAVVGATGGNLVVTGATLGDPCAVGLVEPALSAASSVFTCRVSAANAVAVRWCDVAAVASAAIDAGVMVRIISNQ